jgi:hypothetical protein
MTKPCRTRVHTDAKLNQVLAVVVPIIWWDSCENRGEQSPMLKDGTYAAWFKTPLGQGTGIAHVQDGKIWGGDSIMTYSGSCKVDGDRLPQS